jgi:hypothetical protein
MESSFRFFKSGLSAFLLALFLLAAFSPLAEAAKVSRALEDELFYRINFGSAEDIQVLLDKGVSPNVRTRQNDPAVFIAIDRGDAEAVKMLKILLDRGANPNIPDSAKKSAVVAAAQKGQSEMVEMLIAHGASPYSRSLTDESLLQIAQKQCRPETVALIKTIMDKEIAYASSLRTLERFKKILEIYSYDSCGFEYWSYFITSGADEARIPEARKKIAGIKESLDLLVQQLQLYYANMIKPEDLQRLSESSVNSIYGIMSGMISNRNRADHGFGKDLDMETRCTAIAKELQVSSGVKGYMQ